MGFILWPLVQRHQDKHMVSFRGKCCTWGLFMQAAGGSLPHSSFMMLGKGGLGTHHCEGQLEGLPLNTQLGALMQLP